MLSILFYYQIFLLNNSIEILITTNSIFLSYFLNNIDVLSNHNK